jgi:CrcB protein
MTGYGFLAVGVGAVLGSWLRWWLGILLNVVLPNLPLGTLAANLIGGYLMGLALGYFEHFQALAPETRLMITTGFLGGLTTFSTFSAETTTLLLRHEYGWASLIIGSHVIGSLVMTLLGIGTVVLIKTW